ncbi:MAG TPA: acyl carrier protein [Burkholderiaceae bacterium]|nr:acyl carrier protein [Burkholderiaceae bacterium]
MMQVETRAGQGAQQAADPVFEAICGFLQSAGWHAKDEELTQQTPLLGSGVLDSLGIVQLMVFLGDTLKIEIEDDDFTPENFASIGSLAEFATRKRNESRR